MSAEDDKRERELSDLARNVKNLMANLPAMIEYADYKAKVDRATYLAYLRAGFSEEQSLTLTITKK